MKHTKGPWKTENRKFYIKVVSESENRVILASQNSGTNAEDEANARLIAAAPEMLATLEAVLDRALGDDVVIVQLCKEAIAKATGGSND